MAAEFPEGIAIRDLGEKIAAALGEVKSVREFNDGSSRE